MWQSLVEFRSVSSERLTDERKQETEITEVKPKANGDYVWWPNSNDNNAMLVALVSCV